MGRPVDVLERDGLVRLGDATLSALRAAPPSAADAQRFTVRMTSGTTGRTPVVIANEQLPGDARGFEGSRCLLIAIGGNNTRLANTLLVSTHARTPIRILPLDEPDMVAADANLFADLAPDAVRGFTSFVRRFGEIFPHATNGVQRMKLSGEKWTATTNERMRALFPNARFEPLYITNEIGVIAARDCDQLLLSHYHLAPGVAVEIDAADESGLGEILVTKRFFRDTEAVRYRVGDLARLDPALCACGRPSIELIGRKGSDYLKIAGAVLFREEFDRVAALCRDLFDDYRAEATNGAIGEITLRVFRRDGQWSEPLRREIIERFSKNLFLTPSRTLADLVAEGRFEPLALERAVLEFPRKHKEVTLSERL